jgi:predicted SAM-dependent methyltransferase
VAKACDEAVLKIEGKLNIAVSHGLFISYNYNKTKDEQKFRFLNISII